MSQQPAALTRPKLLDENKNTIIANGKIVETRQYQFVNKREKPIFIQEHSIGHKKATPTHGAEAHFNVRPDDNLDTGYVVGTHGHYNF